MLEEIYIAEEFQTNQAPILASKTQISSNPELIPSPKQ